MYAWIRLYRISPQKDRLINPHHVQAKYLLRFETNDGTKLKRAEGSNAKQSLHKTATRSKGRMKLKVHSCYGKISLANQYDINDKCI
jgi:hypothetical protein